MGAQTEPTCMAFSLIADYAIQQGWTPIRFRSFTVGPWKVTVNGTKTERDGLAPFHALVENTDIFAALMVINPFGGTAGGWEKTEDAFIEAMQSAIAKAEGTQP